MDQVRFDAASRILTNLPTRRDVLRGLTGIGIGLCSLGLSAAAESKSKKKGKKGDPIR